MIKRTPLFNLLLLISDALLISVSFVIANYLKLGRFEPPIPMLMQNSRLLLFASVTLVAIFNYFSLYEEDSKRSEVDEAGAVIGAMTIGMVLFEFMTLFYRDLIFRRMTIFYAWMFSSVLIVFVRISMIQAQKKILKAGIGVSRVLIIGSGDMAQLLAKKITEHPETGLRITGFIKAGNGDVEGLADGSLKDVLSRQKVNKVIFALPDAPTHQIMKLIEICEAQKVEFQFVPRVLDIIESRISTDEVAGIPLVTVREIKLYGFNAFLKRTFDLVLGTAVLLLISPVLAASAVIIKLTSPGPVLFTQVRVGQEGRHFLMYKFRSMRQGAEQEQEKLAALNEADGLIFKIRNDPRVTGVGRFIRKWSIDELPQIFNVLKGDMSFVGPRPPVPGEVEKYNSWHMKRLHITPGITGLWQVSGRSNLSFDEMVKLDIFYIESWSLWQDFKILLKTIPVVLFAKGAY